MLEIFCMIVILVKNSFQLTSIQLAYILLDKTTNYNLKKELG